ncbi:MAG: RDD family protein [Pseudomonadota bacterium]
MLDTTIDVETPEGVQLLIPVAGLAPRAMAWLIDAMIKIALFIVALIVVQPLGLTGMAIWSLFLFTLFWLYNVLFEVLWQGATPGKRALRLRVMNADGTPVGWTGAIVRNLIRPVDALPGCYLFGCLSVLLSRNFQRLGDLAAGTIVAYRATDPERSRTHVNEPIPLAIPLSSDEQEALVSFSERRKQYSQARAEELAQILEPVLGEVDARRVRSYAAWLAGKGAPT